MSKPKPYGYELILDLHGCDESTFNRESLTEFFVQLCDAIDMVRCDLHFWDADNTPQELTSPHTKGTSAVQFIITSNITIHTLNELRAAYVNVFSCKPFDEKVAEELTWRFFGAKSHHIRFIERD